MLSFYASKELAEQAFLANAAAAEVSKLGPNGMARVSAVDTWLRGQLGDTLGGALRSMLVTAATVQGMEKLIMKMTSQDVASFRQHGREPPGLPGRVSEEEYAAMTPAQRWEYSRGFDQSQFRNGR
jgi:hypothetical protein